jgi:hypothetical protein
MPRNVNREETGFYPNLEVEDFGSEMLSFVTNTISQKERVSGDLKLRFRIRDHAVRILEGWWHLLGGDQRRMMIWGILG